MKVDLQGSPSTLVFNCFFFFLMDLMEILITAQHSPWAVVRFKCANN